MKSIKYLFGILLSISLLSSTSLAEPLHFDNHFSTDYLSFLEKSEDMGQHIKELSSFLNPEYQDKIKTFFAVEGSPNTYLSSTKSIAEAINYMEKLPSINQSGSFLGLKESFNSVRNFDELSKYESGVSNREVWSDYYWAFEKGGLANRYLSKEYREIALPIPNKNCTNRDKLKCRNNYMYGCRHNDDIYCFINYLEEDIPKVQANIYNLSKEKIRTLSPAEKYDLLIGDANFTLTYKHIRRLLSLDPSYTVKPGQKINMNDIDPNTLVRNASGQITQYKKRGDYAGWMGICEGVATAQTQLPAARNTIVLKSPFGFDIPFYPQDIRALSSYMYSGASGGNNIYGQSVRFFETTILGSRCDDRKIRTLNNRIIDLETSTKVKYPDGTINDRTLGPADRCRDTAPSVMHISTINSLGKMKRPFVMDSIPDDEVWNYPINEYSISYFNPQTKAGAEDILGDAEFSHSLLGNDQAFVQNPNKALLTNYPAFTDDRYKAHRSDYTYAVGVKLTIKYIDGIPHPHGQFRLKDKNYISSNDERLKSMTLIYDLELDADKNIIGGEWYPFLSDVQVTNENGELILDEDGQYTVKKEPVFNLPDMIFAIPDVAKNNHNLPLTIAERMRAERITVPVFGRNNNLNTSWRALALESTSTSSRSGQVLYNIIKTMIDMSAD